ncbi:hypothetical protein TELCIR_25856 [Teladorsagia circumcincta]|uniref:Chitin-binding type-2 domain-containing protein n=1 Tax=Teladorsagia circumcincta TaxID=45464 RepID=A0A2G9T4F7_TELCI|nr:hypothetical protein TELCIR_25856 [Teladorsagia circumcincta]
MVWEKARQWKRAQYSLDFNDRVRNTDCHAYPDLPFRLLECSMGQVFDNTQQSCVSPDDVPACRAADEASSTTTSSPSARIDCEGMSDGFFEKEPCSSFFLTCSGGISRILTCPANLVFDQK